MQNKKGQKCALYRVRRREKNGDIHLKTSRVRIDGQLCPGGVLQHLLESGNRDYRYIVVPFVDYDGVIDGEQGKFRFPHDHNRDYMDNPIYPETRAVC